MTNSFKIKICGITRPADAVTAANLGADMIGLIMYPQSPRHVNLTQARKIIASLPATVDRVGVMVEPDLETVLRIAERLRLDYLQLHGRVSAKMITSLQKSRLKVIQTFAMKSKSDFEAATNSKADLVLLDTYVEGLHGGSGRPFDWTIKPKPRIPNLVLAGGITADNVKEGVRLFHPLVVDVNSGVERSPGIKSPRILKAFMTACNQIRYGS